MAKPDFPWELDAKSGKPMPEDITSPIEQYAYQAMSHLYARYKLKVISKQDASKEKRLIKAVFEKHRAKEEAVNKAYKHFAEKYLSTGAAMSAYRKATTDAERLAAAEALIYAMDGIPVAERSGDEA